MRIFTDGDGRVWDAAVGRESWGTLVLLFSPRGGGEARTSLLGSESVRDAEAEVAAMSEAELRARLADSRPWGEAG